MFARALLFRGVPGRSSGAGTAASAFFLALLLVLPAHAQTGLLDADFAELDFHRVKEEPAH